jgi:hypothetical protein
VQRAIGSEQGGSDGTKGDDYTAMRCQRVEQFTMRLYVRQGKLAAMRLASMLRKMLGAFVVLAAIGGAGYAASALTAQVG